MNVSPRSRRWLAALLVGVLCATAGWVVYNWRNNRFDESRLRDTNGIDVAISHFNRAPQGFVIDYTIENHTRRTASSIVLTAQVLDENDKPVAGNPLINVLGLAPGEKRSQTALAPLLPGVGTPPAGHATIQTSLVRWME